MCGIAGYFLTQEHQVNASLIESFLSSIQKRGPDDQGAALISRTKGECKQYKTELTCKALSASLENITNGNFNHDVALIHTRYSILDLSEKGHQPYSSRDGSIIGVFNGEIYNFIELRQELMALGVVFNTNCDTEVLIEGYCRWKDLLWAKLNGFWAVVLYDKQERKIILSRDRVGVAPLYYRQTSNGFYFSSTIEPLIDIEGNKASLNEEALIGFALTGFKDVDHRTFYQEIKTFPESSFVKIPYPKISFEEIQTFWSLPTQRITENELSFTHATTQLRELIIDAVRLRLRSDVKLAFELSGGLDSSSVVAAASLINSQQITTFTAKIKGADEEPYARTMLEKYNLDYHVIENMEDRFSTDFKEFGGLMEEPYDNPNAYTHHQMLKKMKSMGVQVVVTGAGGDEVLAGYEASFWPKAYQEWRKEGLQAYLRADWYEFCRRFKTSQKAQRTLSGYLKALGRRFCLCRYSIKNSKKTDHKNLNQIENYQYQYNQISFDQQRQFHFKKALLPFYMRSSDHFTMGIPIEHRFPLLDYRIIEFGFKLPISYLFRNGWTKYILRKAMEKDLPASITWRKEKMGFKFPFGEYLLSNQSAFDAYYNSGKRQFPSVFLEDDYRDALLSDPVKLWRLLSIAIWLKEVWS